MREIVLDTETTGLDPKDGHRIVEIGCVELLNHIPTGQEYHCYINPQRDMPTGAFEVHGLSESFLSKHPVFADVALDFLEFIDNSPLVIHNGAFDLGFLNAELERMGSDILPGERVIDTLHIARRKFPGSPNSLDALCRRFSIDNTIRDKHGALIDSILLARVYLELIGGAQPGLDLVGQKDAGVNQAATDNRQKSYPPRQRPLQPLLTQEEYASHLRFVDEELGEAPLWKT